MIWFLLWWVFGIFGAGFSYASMRYHYGNDFPVDLLVCWVFTLLGPILLAHALWVHGTWCGWRLWP